MTNTEENPFKQAKNIFYVEFETTFQYLNNFIPICEKFSDNIVYFEKDGSRSIESMPEDLWQIQIYFQEEPPLKDLKDDIYSCSAELKIEKPQITSKLVEDIDWVSEVQKNFKPIETGKFYIHNSHSDIKQIDQKISIEINAGRAFGTGEHATTSNCLKALSELPLNLDNCLDLGCGSGILAIAMKKLGAKNVIATDIDEQAVLVTKENCSLNKIRPEEILVSQSNGCKANLIEAHKPFDTITANILAKPLIEMTTDLLTILKKNGILITAGFINSQVAEMLLNFESAGFKLHQKLDDENWPVLVFTK